MTDAGFHVKSRGTCALGSCPQWMENVAGKDALCMDQRAWNEAAGVTKGAEVGNTVTSPGTVNEQTSAWCFMVQGVSSSSLPGKPNPCTL